MARRTQLLQRYLDAGVDINQLNPGNPQWFDGFEGATLLFMMVEDALNGPPFQAPMPPDDAERLIIFLLDHGALAQYPDPNGLMEAPLWRVNGVVDVHAYAVRRIADVPEGFDLAWMQYIRPGGRVDDVRAGLLFNDWDRLYRGLRESQGLVDQSYITLAERLGDHTSVAFMEAVRRGIYIERLVAVQEFHGDFPTSTIFAGTDRTEAPVIERRALNPGTEQQVEQQDCLFFILSFAREVGREFVEMFLRRRQ